MMYVAPGQGEKMPGVLIAHGFAGSKQLMLGYAYVLAHGGYAVMLWDSNGHGANTQSLERNSLQHDLDIAREALLEQPEVDPTRLALLGHSMGSGAVMSAAIAERDRFAATIAISPTGAAVTPESPRNLQLQAGSWEPRFVANAGRLLQQAGGENQNLAEGRGRSFVIVPSVEHITILFKNVSHQVARQWLNNTFGIYSTSSYLDRRIVWYGLHLLAWLLLLFAVAPILNRVAFSHRELKVREAEEQGSRGDVREQGELRKLRERKPSKIQNLKSKIPTPVRKGGGLLLAPLVATGVLAAIASMADIQSLGGVLVGGAVGIWFCVAGLVWWSAIARLPRPTLAALGLGAALFILLWVAFGAMAQVVWLQWWLIPARLQLWLLLSLLCFPWFLASGLAQQKAEIGERLMWWLGQSLVLVFGFFLTLQFLPQLSFIFLLLPLFPIFTAMFSFVAAMLKPVWSYALGCALFFGWVLAAAFPLAG
jgi:pimeloyl-ACP methyl ester carboxylesterase